MPRHTFNAKTGARFTGAFLLALSVVGCKGTVGYETNPDTVTLAPHRLPVHVALLRLQDDRPQEEMKADSTFLTWWDTTEDSSWKDGDLPAAISQMAARHLDACGLFAKVDYLTDFPDPLDDAALAKLRAMGYQMVLTGKIEHFTGTRRWDLTRAGLFTLAGPIGTGVNVALGHRAGGLVILRPLSLIRTSDGSMIWEGDAVGDVQETTYLTGTAPTYANEALRLGLNNLSQQLDTESGDLATRLDCRREEIVLPPPPPEPPKDPTIVDKTLDQGKKGLQTVGKAANKAGEALDSALDKVINVVK